MEHVQLEKCVQAVQVQLLFLHLLVISAPQLVFLQLMD
jgi:hypothetical protein